MRLKKHIEGFEKKLYKKSSSDAFVELADKLDEAAKILWEASSIWGKMNDENHEQVVEVFEKHLAYNLGLFADSLEKSSNKIREIEEE